MIAPELIESKEFKKGFRGYNEEEVDVFLDQIKEDYEAIIKENESLKENWKCTRTRLVSIPASKKL